MYLLFESHKKHHSKNKIKQVKTTAYICKYVNVFKKYDI